MALGTPVKVLFLLVSLVIGIGISMFLLPDLLPFLDQETLIIIGVVLSFFSFISLYFMAKGGGG